MSILDRVENQEAIEAAKAEILAALDVGVAAKAIRHIQRGRVWMYVGNDADMKKTINLSGFTNADKMVVLLDGSLEYSTSSGGDSFSVLTYLESLTTTELVFATSYFTESYKQSSDGKISYQVIEFY